jgi:hypothetical protein
MTSRAASPSRATIRLLTTGLCAGALQGACSHDWDAYDPRLAGGTAGVAAGGGGSGGTSTTSTTGGAGGGGVCNAGDTAPCYTGADGTQGMGLCVAGLATCLPDGTGFGPCEGEITPGTETCGPADEDCDGQINEPDAGCTCTPGETTACYGGPGGTQNVGQCQAGVQVCSPDGAGYGLCLGQVLPSAEDCATAVDDNCDGTLNTHCALWSKRFGGGFDQNPRAFALHGAGGMVIAGDAAGMLSFGGANLPEGGGADVFVARLDGGGNHVWSRRFGDATYQSARAVAVDPAGNVYVTGMFAGTLDFGIMPVLVSAGEIDVFVAKLDSAGNPLWCKSFGDPLQQSGLAIAADASGVVIGGNYQGTIDLGGVPTTSFELEDGFVVKLDPAGAHVWSVTFGNTGRDSVLGLAVDAAGDVLVTGTFDELLSLGGPVITDKGSTDAFAGKLDGATGAHVWSKGFGGLQDQEGSAIAVDPGGNVLVAGWFEGDINFGAGAATSAGAMDMFVVKLDSGGNHVWDSTFGAVLDQAFHSVASDGAGNVLLTASMAGTVDFGGGALLGAGSDDVVVVKLSPGGAHVFSRRFGDPNDQDGRSVIADAQGNVLLAVDCEGTVDFGAGSLPSAGDADICVAKLPP